MRPEFEICTVNYGADYGILQDIVEIVQAGIADAGYVVRKSLDRFYADRFHILFDRLQPELSEFLAAHKLRYGLMVSEEISPDGAFGWSTAEHGGQPYELGRAYAAQVERAAFVWCHFEKSLEFCRKHNDRVGLVPFGFSPRLLPRHTVAWDKRDIPGLITGALTERRASVLAECVARGFSLQHAGHPLPGWMRDSYLARAHLHVAPHRSAEHVRYVNVQRAIQSLCFKVGLVVELEPGSVNDYADFVDTAAPGSLVDKVLEVYADSEALRRTLETRLERFADTRAMAKPFADLIAATVGD